MEVDESSGEEEDFEDFHYEMEVEEPRFGVQCSLMHRPRNFQTCLLCLLQVIIHNAFYLVF